MSGDVWIGRLLGAGAMCAGVGAAVWVVYLALRPPCANGFIRFIDLIVPIIVLLMLALVAQGLAWWRWRVSPGRGLTFGLALTGLLALLPTVFLTLIGIWESATKLGRAYDPGCWSF